MKKYNTVICVDNDNVDILDWISTHFDNGNWHKNFEVTVTMQEVDFTEDGRCVYVDEMEYLTIKSFDTRTGDYVYEISKENIEKKGYYASIVELAMHIVARTGSEPMISVKSKCFNRLLNTGIFSMGIPFVVNDKQEFDVLVKYESYDFEKF